MLRLIVLFMISSVFSGCFSNEKKTLYYNGKVVTLDDQNPEITRFIVSDGKILSTDPDEISTLSAECADSIDLGGKMILPGLTDAHLHLFSLGFSLMNLDLSGEKGIPSIQKKLTSFILNDSSLTWIKGRGWDQNLWPEKEFPVASDLDKVIKDKPVVLTRIDGHAIWVNSLVLKMAGIGKETPDPPGGKIVRNLNGFPTGVLIDNAADLVTQLIPEPNDDEMKMALRLAISACNATGLTSVHDAGTTLKEIRILKSCLSEPWFTLRVYSMVSSDSLTWGIYKKKGPETGLGNNKLSIRGVKIYADGALGSRGAWLKNDYADQPGNKGLQLIGRPELEKMVGEAVNCGMQPAVHAIGDAANQLALDVFSKFSAGNGSTHRFRVEHAQLLSPDDISRFGSEHIIASMQPVHATSDMPWAEQRVGSDRIRGGYAWRSILDDDGLLAFGSDAPVESVNPFWGIYAAVTRQDHNGNPTGGWFPGQALTVSEALTAFTEGANYAGFNEKSFGKIRPGFYADFIQIDHDIFEILPSDLYKIRVLSLWFGGDQVSLHR